MCNNDCKNCIYPECKEDNYDTIKRTKKKKKLSNSTKRNKYFENQAHKEKIFRTLNLKRSDGSSFSSYYPAYYSRYYKRPDQHFHLYRFYSIKSKKMLKRSSNKKVRNSFIPNLKGNSYRKIFPDLRYWDD